MTDQELILKQNKTGAFWLAFIITMFPVTIGCGRGKSLFLWKHFYPDVVITILFFLSLILCLLGWLNYRDDRPLLKLDKEGIWQKKYLLSSSLTLISWSNINYFYILKERNRNLIIQTLILGMKDSDRDIRVLLANLDQPAETVISLVEEYSLSYGFQQLENETS